MKNENDDKIKKIREEIENFGKTMTRIIFVMNHVKEDLRGKEYTKEVKEEKMAKIRLHHENPHKGSFKVRE